MLSPSSQAQAEQGMLAETSPDHDPTTPHHTASHNTNRYARNFRQLETTRDAAAADGAALCDGAPATSHPHHSPIFGLGDGGFGRRRAMEMPQPGDVAVDADIRGEGGFSLLPGEWRKTLGSGGSVSRRGDYHRH